MAASSMSSGAMPLAARLPERVDELRPAGVVEGDVEQQAVALGGRVERVVDRRPGRPAAARRAGRAAGCGRPAARSSSVSLRIAASSRPNSPVTSSSERAQFSRLKAYSVRTGTPRRTAWRRRPRIASTPAAWPSSSGRSRCRAQRRLPSMMIATWRGRSSGATAARTADAGGASGRRRRLVRRGRRVGRPGQRCAGH